MFDLLAEFFCFSAGFGFLLTLGVFYFGRLADWLASLFGRWLAARFKH